jgi:arylsulfatase A-like enzyme
MKNIVLVVADTLSSSHLQSYGYDRDTAPFLASLAEDNLFFENAYSTGPWTVPSHASIFSGELPKDHGTTSENLYFSSDSFVEELSEKGYNTYGISNNHLISKDLGFAKGFDFFEEDKGVYFEAEGLKTLKALWNMKKGGDIKSGIRSVLGTFAKNRDLSSLVELSKYSIRRLVDDGYEFESYLSITDDGAESTNKLIKEELSEEPFFLFANYMEPHEPYNPPESIAEEWVSDVEQTKLNYEEKMYGRPSFRKEVDEELKEEVKGLYDAEIRYFDKKVEELYEYINSNFEDTLFIVVGDHGEMLGEHGMWGHQHGVWQKLVKVPMIIAGDGINGGRVEDTVSLAELKEIIIGKKGIDEIGGEKAFSEYYGLKGFVIDYGEKEVSDYSEEEMPYVLNSSKAVFSQNIGFVENTEIDDISFPEDLSEGQRKKLKESLSQKFQEQESLDEVDF